MGGSRKYLLAGLDQSLNRMGVEYVDILIHRVDENTPMEQTAAALAHAVQSGKALYVGISSYSTERTAAMTKLLREWRSRFDSTSRLTTCLTAGSTRPACWTRWRNGTGCIAFTPLAQGLLTGKYLNGIPDGSRMQREGKKVRGLTEKMLTEANLSSLRLLTRWRTRAGRRWRRWR
ncbi:aldo/keto reductase [Enterobacter hormaechei]